MVPSPCCTSELFLAFVDETDVQGLPLEICIKYIGVGMDHLNFKINYRVKTDQEPDLRNVCMIAHGRHQEAFFSLIWVHRYAERSF